MNEFLKESRERILSGYEKIKEQFPGVFEETDKKIKEQEPDYICAAFDVNAAIWEIMSLRYFLIMPKTAWNCGINLKEYALFQKRFT